jgi:hypothetical protein
LASEALSAGADFASTVATLAVRGAAALESGLAKLALQAQVPMQKIVMHTVKMRFGLMVIVIFLLVVGTRKTFSSTQSPRV